MALAAAVLLVLLIALFLYALRLRRDLKYILQAAERLAQGDHDARVRLAPQSALGRLGVTLNLLAERFQHDIAELKRLEQVRKDFVANVSHELRTPLATIKAFSETLNSGGLEDTVHRSEFAREIEANADRMTRLVDDLLEISALESGRMPPDFKPLSLMKVAAEVTASLKPIAGRRQIVLRLEPFHGIPEVRADRNQLKQVFTNLLDNAVKYSAEKETVRISADSRDGHVTVSISNTGIGIPAEDLPRVFERFYRVDKARSRELGGTGLGLSIVKHIIELHGGSVSAESPPAGATIFRFSLPAIH